MVPARYRPDPLDAPLHVAGPEGPWDEVGDRLDDVGRAVICTTWGQWLAAVLLDPALRPLLGSDWPRYRQTAPAAGRMRFAVSRFVVKYSAAAALNVPVDTLDLGYEPGGAPLVRGAGEDLEVSLAHTGELIVVGVSRTGPIGVDVQAADRDVAFGVPPGQLCTAEEGAALAALPESERRARLLCLWTLKEAYGKALGHGGRRCSSAFGFDHDERGRVVLAGAPQEGDAAGQWRFTTHLVQERYLVGAAHRRRPALPVAAARKAQVDTGSRSAAVPLEERGSGSVDHLRFLRPVSSGRGEGRRTP
ncbi:4'-phosphopantetheinyl transferase family protein [Streptomyces sp. NBC_01233]|uniref:4'-phosphopantetheinyl transferase family protein n=1 Tax=Streptomyces sp. NBC_01233 TaxID=2903787 RepID=UPI002E163057|nr:4'-phosphopantetheinyl transferase superfamily protein [Streptomyces sp. NBC_01233]WSP95948.1 4'-phosphopantetheinyl transferase superfamily protein [Streptomyces sp. NBC_01233]